MKTERAERNTSICNLYREGWTQADLANRFHLSEARIGQILKRAGLTKEDRPEPPTIKRPSFVGINLPTTVKNALRAEAEREDSSMSSWVANLVIRELTSRGVPIEIEPSTEEDVPLPLEG